MTGLTAVARVLAGMLVCLALAIPQARAELRGKVHRVVNVEAPRAEWRRVPVPGAYVAVWWSVTVPAPAHAVTTCRYSELARSDEQGEYVMEGPNFVTAQVGRVAFVVYSPGLDLIDFPYGGSARSAVDITMARSALSPDERLSRLAMLADPPCFDVKLDDPRGVRKGYLDTLIEEAKGLQVDSPRGRRDLQHIEAVVRRASGQDRAAPIRPVIVPSPGARQSTAVPREKQSQ